MKKSTARTKGGEAAPFDKRKVNLDKIKLDFTQRDLKRVFDPVIDIGTVPIFSWPIETLSPVKTVGRGRTNLTLIRPTIVQTDANTPHASFDRRESPNRNPVVQMHFEPNAYGITAPSTYIMSFKIEAVGACTFNLAGSFGLLSNAGARTVNGLTTISLTFTGVPAATQLFGFIEQTAGGRWNWFSTEVRFPALVLQQ
jgi:hypothetical protein